MSQYFQTFRHRDLGKQCLQTQIRFSEQFVCQTERPDQKLLTLRSSLIRICTIYQSVCIFWMHYSMLKSYLNFRICTFFRCPNVLEFYGAVRIYMQHGQETFNSLVPIICVNFACKFDYSPAVRKFGKQLGPFW